MNIWHNSSGSKVPWSPCEHLRVRYGGGPPWIQSLVDVNGNFSLQDAVGAQLCTYTAGSLAATLPYSLSFDGFNLQDNHVHTRCDELIII
jgi:hypothetical protein